MCVSCWNLSIQFHLRNHLFSYLKTYVIHLHSILFLVNLLNWYYIRHVLDDSNELWWSPNDFIMFFISMPTSKSSNIYFLTLGYQLIYIYSNTSYNHHCWFIIITRFLSWSMYTPYKHTNNYTCHQNSSNHNEDQL